jgi:SAM-dependent methyltransferase
MFSPHGPSLRELAVQALSSVEHGYDLLAPKFDHTPFRTPDGVLDAVEHALGALGPFDHGLDLCCGTGAGMEVLRRTCRESVTGVDLSTGMLTVGRAHMEEYHTGADHMGPGHMGSGRMEADRIGPDRTESGHTGSGHTEPGPAGPRPAVEPRVSWVRGDARALPFGPAFDLVVSFGALGHFLPGELPGLFTQVRSVLRPGGRFAFPVGAPPRPTSVWFWTLLGFDTAMRVRNAVWRPPFVMYYRAFRFGDVLRELHRAGFDVELRVLPEFGRRPDGSPRCRLVVAARGA